MCVWWLALRPGTCVAEQFAAMQEVMLNAVAASDAQRESGCLQDGSLGYAGLLLPVVL